MGRYSPLKTLPSVCLLLPEALRNLVLPAPPAFPCCAPLLLFTLQTRQLLSVPPSGFSTPCSMATPLASINLRSAQLPTGKSFPQCPPPQPWQPSDPCTSCETLLPELASRSLGSLPPLPAPPPLTRVLKSHWASKPELLPPFAHSLAPQPELPLASRSQSQ